LLVERLDEAYIAYYLVPWHPTLGKEDLIIRLDAMTGKFLGFVVFPKSNQPYYLQADEALRIAHAVKPSAKPGSQRCVWRPCLQSTTPFQPLYEITLDGEVVYVDMRGTAHRELIPLGRGGAGDPSGPK
jgi:hypothetical protein